MKTEYDFSQARKNPYAKELKQQITINIDRESHILKKKTQVYHISRL